MEGYKLKWKDMVFQSSEALKQVVNIINEATSALNDKTRTIRESAIPGVLIGALSGVGGGMIAGACAFISPVGTLVATAGSVAIAHLVNVKKQRKLQQEKERLYKEAIIKQEAIIKALKEEAEATKERLDYLQSLNALLQQAVNDLSHDLGIA